ncbi:MAG: hypothetical protein CFH35_00770 [Alphaproteobacteria bacterium MarineAlpha9_Bin5]|nr:MAG: hypothetical protein CFH35_00770 [Alphaproteobacteria bacterium MarineAlpha9_Bin5]
MGMIPYIKNTPWRRAIIAANWANLTLTKVFCSNRLDQSTLNRSGQEGCFAVTCRKLFAIRKPAFGIVMALALLCTNACQTSQTQESIPESEVDNKNSAMFVPALPPTALPKSALGGYLAGRHARNIYDSRAASVFFGRALQADPNNPELLRRTLTATVGERRMGESLSLSNRLISLQILEPVALLSLATELVRTGAFPAARRQLSSLPKTGFYPYLQSLLAAWTFAGEGDGSAALEKLQFLTKSSNFSATHDYHASLIAELLGLTNLASATYKSTVSTVRGPSLRSVLAAGSFYERYGRIDDARRLYEAFPSAGPETTVIDAAMARLETGQMAPQLIANAREGFAEALYEIGASFFKDRAYEPALIYTQMALHARPNLDVARILLADLYAATEHYVEAVETFREVPPESPFLWSARIRLAHALNQVGKLDEASRELRALAAERLERADPLMTLADLLRAEERYQDAVSVYDEAIARIATIEQHHWTVFYARGMSLERSGQWPRAESDLLRALELQPDQPLVLNYLGYSWVDMGVRLPEARSMIERAVAQRPNDGYIVDSLGWVLYQLEDFEAALVHLERAVELRPNDPVITDHYGDALWRIGRHSEARFQWRRALSLDPDANLAESVEEKLERDKPDELRTTDKS